MTQHKQKTNTKNQKKNKNKSWQTSEKRGELPSAVLIFLFGSHCSGCVFIKKLL